jgi:PAS domain S-box-containing protein
MDVRMWGALAERIPEMIRRQTARRALGSSCTTSAPSAHRDKRALYAHAIAAARDPIGEQLLAILPAMLFTSGPDGTWDYVNPPFCAYTGRPPEALTGMGWAAVVHADDRDASLAHWQSAIPRGTPFLREQRLRGADGSYQWFRTECVPQRTPAGAITRWAGIVTPSALASQVASERALRLAAEQSRDERDSAIAMVSHELRAPLTVLLGQAQLLQRRLAESPGADQRDQRAVDILIDQTLRLAKLIRALTDVAHIDQGQLYITRTTLDLSALVERVVQALQPALAAHTLQLNASAAPIWVVGDAIRLEQVLQNLLQNAVKYSPAGGPIAIWVTSEGHQARIAVSDHGIGIAPASMPHLFQRFYRARQEDGPFTTGLGLGLYICKAIMELHGGSITAESRVGVGSTFAVLLPHAEAQPSLHQGIG